MYWYGGYPQLVFVGSHAPALPKPPTRWENFIWRVGIVAHSEPFRILAFNLLNYGLGFFAGRYGR